MVVSGGGHRLSGCVNAAGAVQIRRCGVGNGALCTDDVNRSRGTEMTLSIQMGQTRSIKTIICAGCTPCQTIVISDFFDKNPLLGFEFSRFFGATSADFSR